MILKKKFYLNKKALDLDFTLKRAFTKYLYTKFLITYIGVDEGVPLIYLDNFLARYVFNIDKSFTRLKFYAGLQSGKFLKAEVFLFKSLYTDKHLLFSFNFQAYIKKNIKKILNSLSITLFAANLVFFYKSIPGGFLGFSNKICGYISKKKFYKIKEKCLRYKRYYLVFNVLCAPKLMTAPSFRFGPVSNLQNYTQRGISNRFTFIFNAKSVLLNSLLGKIILILKKVLFTNLNNYFYNVFFKLYKLLIA